MNRLALVLVAAGVMQAADLQLPLRSRVEAFKGSGIWEEVDFRGALPESQTAIVICDMWDRHWCSGATKRVEVLARKMAPVIDRAREKGIAIVHAPSDTMAFYRNDPHRLRILQIAPVEPPAALEIKDAPLPIDDASGGCDTGEKTYIAWAREHPALRIAGDDVISDNGREIYSYLREKGVKYLLVMGVHTNMCILNRTFAIKQMTKWGMRCVLVRDLTDAMYDPKDRPYVSHDQGTGLVIEHIEKYWCPTVLSTELMSALASAK